MNDPFSFFLGIKGSHIAAGLFGGLSRALISRGMDAAAGLKPRIGVLGSLASGLVGMFTAGYLTPALTWLAGSWGLMPVDSQAAQSMEHAVAFIAGLTGMTLCEGIILIVQRWRENPTLPMRKRE